MKKLVFFMLGLCLIGPESQAQAPVSPFSQEIVVPTGPRGEYTLEEGQIFALRQVNGTILSTDGRKDEDKYFHQYEILTNDNSVYVVEISAITGEVNNIYVNALGEDPNLPFEHVSAETAELLAANDVEEKTRGVRKPKVLSSVLGIRNQVAVYVVRVKKSVRTYQVLVDARNGRVFEINEE